MGLFNNNKPPEGGNVPPAGNNNTPPSGGNTPPVDVKPEVYRWRCVEACTFQGRYRKEGDIVELAEKRDALPHFVPVI